MEGKTELVMNITANPEVKAIMQVAHIRPAVSIIMPFEPKMGIKSELAHGLKLAVDKVERMLRTDYPADISALVVYKLRRIIKDLNFNTHKKSIAVYVSPVFENYCISTSRLRKRSLWMNHLQYVTSYTVKSNCINIWYSC